MDYQALIYHSVVGSVIVPFQGVLLMNPGKNFVFRARHVSRTHTAVVYCIAKSWDDVRVAFLMACRDFSEPEDSDATVDAGKD